MLHRFELLGLSKDLKKSIIIEFLKKQIVAIKISYADYEITNVLYNSPQ